MPDSEYINSQIERIKQAFIELGINTNYDMSFLFSTEQPFDDFKVKMYGKEVVILDMSFVEKGLKTFRPVIRGLMVLFMLLFNYNQLMGLIGQSPISIVGAFKSLSGKGETSE